MRRGEEPDGTPVEFVLPSGDDAPVSPGGRDSPWRLRLQFGAAAVVLALFAAAAALGAPHGTHPRSNANRHPIGPVSIASAAPVRHIAVDPPSPAITALFADVLPGSVVVDERSILLQRVGGTRVLGHRSIDAVSGNVAITVTVRHAPTRAPMGHRRDRIEHAGYEIDFRFAGWYAPNAAQLRALADDPRMTRANA